MVYISGLYSSNISSSFDFKRPKPTTGQQACSKQLHVVDIISNVEIVLTHAHNYVG